MGLLTTARSRVDQADLLLLANVETIRDQMQPATPSAVAALIGGAPLADVARRLARMTQLGCLEQEPGYFQLSELGAELLRVELIGWSPSNREDRRREYELMARSRVRAG